MSTRSYEAIIILDERRCQDGGTTFLNEAGERAVSMGGTVQLIENMGRRQFSAPINKRRTGLYWSLVMDLPQDKVTEFQDSYKLDRAVMRLQVLHYQPKPEPPVEEEAASESESK